MLHLYYAQRSDDRGMYVRHYANEVATAARVVVAVDHHEVVVVVVMSSTHTLVMMRTHRSRHDYTTSHRLVQLYYCRSDTMMLPAVVVTMLLVMAVVQTHRQPVWV